MIICLPAKKVKTLFPDPDVSYDVPNKNGARSDSRSRHMSADLFGNCAANSRQGKIVHTDGYMEELKGKTATALKPLKAADSLFKVPRAEIGTRSNKIDAFGTSDSPKVIGPEVLPPIVNLPTDYVDERLKPESTKWKNNVWDRNRLAPIPESAVVNVTDGPPDDDFECADVSRKRKRRVRKLISATVAPGSNTEETRDFFEICKSARRRTQKKSAPKLDESFPAFKTKRTYKCFSNSTAALLRDVKYELRIDHSVFIKHAIARVDCGQETRRIPCHGVLGTISKVYEDGMYEIIIGSKSMRRSYRKRLRKKLRLKKIFLTVPECCIVKKSALERAKRDKYEAMTIKFTVAIHRGVYNRKIWHRARKKRTGDIPQTKDQPSKKDSFDSSDDKGLRTDPDSTDDDPRETPSKGKVHDSEEESEESQGQDEYAVEVIWMFLQTVSKDATQDYAREILDEWYEAIWTLDMVDGKVVRKLSPDWKTYLPEALKDIPEVPLSEIRNRLEQHDCYEHVDYSLC